VIPYRFSKRDAVILSGIVGLAQNAERETARKTVNEVITATLERFSKEQLVDLFRNFIFMGLSVESNARDFMEAYFISETDMHPHDAEKLNLPTLWGALYGVGLAAGVDSNKACEGCAFRLGTHANQSPGTTVDADSCVHGYWSDDPFWCHEDLKDGQPTKKCVGYALKKSGILGQGKVKKGSEEKCHTLKPPDTPGTAKQARKPQDH